MGESPDVTLATRDWHPCQSLTEGGAGESPDVTLATIDGQPFHSLTKEGLESHLTSPWLPEMGSHATA